MSARKKTNKNNAGDSPEPDEELDTNESSSEKNAQLKTMTKPNTRSDGQDTSKTKSGFCVQMDPQEGLMPQILSLISSPKKNEKKPKKSLILVGSTRECSSCSAPGDLICCSRCSSYFHLLCHNPPLDEDRLPQAKWICFSCSADEAESNETSKKRQKRSESSNSDSSKPGKSTVVTEKCSKTGVGQSASSQKSQGEHIAKAIICVEREDDTNCASGSQNHDALNVPDDNAGEVPDEDDAEEGRTISSIFSTLLSNVAKDNSVQYELPKDISLVYTFPGDGKPRKKRQQQIRALRNDPSGQSFYGSKERCFVCNGSWRNGALVGCDYCTLSFHLDCLDPPLTTMPLNRWMCPQHPNHFLDERLQTGRRTERVRIWNMYCATPITEHTVLTKFLQRATLQHPPFNHKKIIEPEDTRLPVPSHLVRMYASAYERHEQMDWLHGVMSLNPKVFDFDDVTVDDLGDVTVKVLATRMIEQIRSTAKQVNESTSNERDQKVPHMEARAIIRPALGSNGPSVAIGKKQFHIKIGKCSSADVNLELYTECKHASARHASIFYDTTTDRYELLNYSEFGTQVDGILYSNNVEHVFKENVKSAAQAIRNMLKEKKNKEKRAPMKRGRKSKAEKAAMTETEAKATVLRNAQSRNVSSIDDDEDGQERELKESRKIEGKKPSAGLANANRNEIYDTEETTSVCGDHSDPSPSQLYKNTVFTQEAKPQCEDKSTNSFVPGMSFSCICDMTNVVHGLPVEGFEGVAPLNNGSVIKIGCLALIFQTC